MASGADNDPANIFTILVATDCHLGYMEKDPIRGKDSFITFEEILKHAQSRNVDFILLGGDLFHDNKPSRKTLHQTMVLFRKYCMGDRPCQIEFLSDQSVNFGHCAFNNVNYEDPNYNVAYPVFSVHGNHDDPTGQEHDSLSAIDLLSVTGLLNHFGKASNIDDIEITPVLMQKGSTKLALYGLGAVRDERLYRTFTKKKVKMLRPKEDQDSWFNVFVLHQNRSKHGAKNHVPENFLDEFLDLVIWGHEHECLIDAKWSESGKPFYISQPGSSVATSLAEGEAVPKHVGLLQIFKKSFKLDKIPLKTIRPFVMDDVTLSETSLDPCQDDQVWSFLTEKVQTMIDKASDDLPEEQQPQRPLIRLKVEYSGGFVPINPHRFGQQFVDKVANNKDILLFYRKRTGGGQKGKSETDGPGPVFNIDPSDHIRMEDLVKEYLSNAENALQLNILSERRMIKALKEFVDKDEKDAIAELVKWQLDQTQTELYKRKPKEDKLEEEIEKVKNCQVAVLNEEEEDEEIEKVLSSTRSKRQDDIDMPSDDDVNGGASSDEGGPKPSSSKRGGRGRGSRGGRGWRGGRGGSSNSTQSESSRGREKRGRGRAAANNSLLTDSFIKITKSRQSKNAQDDDYDDDISLSTAARNKRSQAQSKRGVAINISDDSDEDSDPFSMAPSSKRRKGR